MDFIGFAGLALGFAAMSFPDALGVVAQALNLTCIASSLVFAGFAFLALPTGLLCARRGARAVKARHRAAEEHVLTKTRVSDLNKRLYRSYVIEERPIDEVAREFGVTRNQVSQTKTRIGRMVAAIEGV